MISYLLDPHQLTLINPHISRTNSLRSLWSLLWGQMRKIKRSYLSLKSTRRRILNPKTFSLPTPINRTPNTNQEHPPPLSPQLSLTYPPTPAQKTLPRRQHTEVKDMEWQLQLLIQLLINFSTGKPSSLPALLRLQAPLPNSCQARRWLRLNREDQRCQPLLLTHLPTTPRWRWCRICSWGARRGWCWAWWTRQCSCSPLGLQTLSLIKHNR